MPETRKEIIQHFAATDEQTPVLLSEEVNEYEVSDEELAQEEEDRLCEEYLGRSPPLMTHLEVCFLLRAFGKKLGYEVD